MDVSYEQVPNKNLQNNLMIIAAMFLMSCMANKLLNLTAFGRDFVNSCHILSLQRSFLFIKLPKLYLIVIKSSLLLKLQVLYLLCHSVC